VGQLLQIRNIDKQGIFSSRNVSICLLAAWEFADRRAATHEGSAWSWFLGYFQGKTGLEIPLNWEINLCREFYRRDDTKQKKALAAYLRRTNIGYDVDGFVVVRSLPTKKAELQLRIPADLDLIKENDGFAILVGPQRRVLISEALLKKMRGNVKGEMGLCV